jgi:hypothetical protein
MSSMCLGPVRLARRSQITFYDKGGQGKRNGVAETPKELSNKFI